MTPTRMTTISQSTSRIIGRIVMANVYRSLLRSLAWRSKATGRPTCHSMACSIAVDTPSIKPLTKADGPVDAMYLAIQSTRIPARRSHDAASDGQQATIKTSTATVETTMAQCCFTSHRGKCSRFCSIFCSRSLLL